MRLIALWTRVKRLFRPEEVEVIELREEGQVDEPEVDRGEGLGHEVETTDEGKFHSSYNINLCRY